jgi:glucose-6-phosphate 1-epimerase
MTPAAQGSALTGFAIESADGARARISAHGAQLLSWRPAGGREWLYLSRAAQTGPGRAIRGGVPVIFPQFAAEGPLPRHGFARVLPWALMAHGRDGEGRGYARYQLADDAATRAVWPHAFIAELTATISGAWLEIGLQIRNIGSAPFTFTAALHSYLRVADVAAARVHGLQGLRYRDSANGDTPRTEDQARLAISGEVDRIYFDAPPQVELHDQGRSLRIGSRNFPDLVLWNPGAEKAAALHDLDTGGWQRMLCIEAAVIGAPVRLAPDGVWRAAQVLEETS